METNKAGRCVEVRVGQVWEDWDIRFRATFSTRKLKVLEIVDGKAVCQSPSGLGRKTKIRLGRFRPTATGYRLVQDV